MEHRFQPGDRVRVADGAFRWSAQLNGREGVVLEQRGRMSDGRGPDLLVRVDLGLAQNVIIGERDLSPVQG